MYNSLAENSFFSFNEDSNALIKASDTHTEPPALQRKHHSLAQLLKQHQHQEGWILLLAPAQLPDKTWAERYHLQMNHVLVVQQKQILDLFTTLQQALNSASCKVVINFAHQLSMQQLAVCQRLAVKNNIWFYQYDQLGQQRTAH